MTSTDTIAGLGARSDHVAPAPLLDRGRLRLSAEEAILLDAIGKVASIGEVLQRSGMPEPRAIALLLALRVKGAIVPARVSRPSAAGAVDAALLEQVDLDEARKREILELERSLDAIDHFALLGLAPGASREEAKVAYHEASRRFHPDRFYGRNLGSFRGRIERIFKRLSEANNVLGDETRRAAYLAQHPHLAAPDPRRAADPEEQAVLEQRDAERRARLARHPYLARASKAKELVDAGRKALQTGDLHRARTSLEQAAALDPKQRDAKGLVEDVRKREAQKRAADDLEKGNAHLAAGDLPRALDAFRSALRNDPDSATAASRVALLVLKVGSDLKEAKAAIERAAQLEPRNAQFRVVQAQIHEALGMKALAKKFLEEALKLDPKNAEAKAAVKKNRWSF